MPRCSATVAAWVRSFTLSFSRTWLTCNFTVTSAILRTVAISLLPSPLGDHAQDFHFAGAQRAMGAALSQMRSDNGIYILSSLMHLAHGTQKFFPNDALDDVPLGAGLQSAINLLFSGVCGKHQDVCIREFVKDGGGALSATHSGKPEIHHDQVGSIFAVTLRERQGRCLPRRRPPCLAPRSKTRTGPCGP